MTARRGRTHWKPVAGTLALALALVPPAVFGFLDDVNEPPPDLRLAGSGTIGEVLVPQLAVAFLRGYGATPTIAEELDGPQNAKVVTVSGTPAGGANPIRIEITILDSAYAFTALDDDDADIGMASRSIRSSEENELRLNDLQETVVAQDAAAVIVNQANPIQSITESDLRGIFGSCTINEWQAVGGPNQRIEAWAPPPGSDTTETLEINMLRGHPVCTSDHIRRIESDNGAELAEIVSENPNAVAVVGRPFVGKNKVLPLASGPDGQLLEPTAENVYDSTYELGRDLYFYTPQYPTKNDLATEFTKYTTGPEGRDIVLQAGFFDPYAPAPDPAPDGTCAPERLDLCSGAIVEPAGCALTEPAYCQLIDGTLRVTSPVKFDSSSAAVDALTGQRLDQLCALLLSPAFSDQRIVLAGFADSVGSSNTNQRLSETRAAAVRQELVGRGVPEGRVADIRGFGEAGTFANPDLPENRRVEIWLREG